MSPAAPAVAPAAEAAPAAPTAVGFFGKIPSRGDFVRAGLPRGFTDPWDGWLQRSIAASRDLLGDAWLPAWMEAPIWHFALPPGHCGAAAVLGLWMPSVDAAGRHFPLTLARLGPPPADPAAWLAAAEAAGLAALQDDLAPDALLRRLAVPARDPPADPVPDLNHPAAACSALGGSLAHWWTEGSPFVPAGRLDLSDLPDAACFAAMLHAAQPEIPPGAEGVRE